MKQTHELQELPIPAKKRLSRATLLAGLALGLSAAGAFAQYDVIITPDQFLFQGWDDNLFQSDGYYWTPGWSKTPKATVLIPLPAGMPSGWHQYDIYEWTPATNSLQWRVVDIAADGTTNNNPTMPWAGQYGSNHQYLQDPQNDQGAWVKLGPGPQSDPNNDGGYGVWMDPTTGNGYPYLLIHFLGFENAPESFGAFHVVQIDVPEPSVLALGLLGGWTLLSGRFRSRHTEPRRCRLTA